MRRILLLVLVVWVSGCAGSLEASQVSRRFESVFACPHAHVVSEVGGYRAEGCGKVAHFRCIDTDDDLDEEVDEHGMLGALGAMTRADTCVMEHVSAPRPLVPARPAVARRTSAEGTAVLATRVLLRGGHLSLRAMPGKDPRHVLLGFYSIARLSDGPCGAELFVDGVALPIAALERPTDHALHVAVPVASLRGVGTSVRFAGQVCGFEVDLDEPSRTALGVFEARFREELSRLARAP